MTEVNILSFVILTLIGVLVTFFSIWERRSTAREGVYLAIIRRLENRITAKDLYSYTELERIAKLHEKGSSAPPEVASASPENGVGERFFDGKREW